MANFSFKTFNGNFESYSDAPEDLLNYDNYIIFEYGSNVYVFCFDKIIECKLDSSAHYYYINNENGEFVRFFRRYGYPANKWFCDEDNRRVSDSFRISACSESLLPFKDLILSGNFYIDLSQNENQEENEDDLLMFTLRPIVQEVDEREDILKSTFTEVFSILPVLITVLISYIGIRKGIFFLLSQINKS